MEAYTNPNSLSHPLLSYNPRKRFLQFILHSLHLHYMHIHIFVYTLHCCFFCLPVFQISACFLDGWIAVLVLAKSQDCIRIGLILAKKKQDRMVACVQGSSHSEAFRCFLLPWIGDSFDFNYLNLFFFFVHFLTCICNYALLFFFIFFISVLLNCIYIMLCMYILAWLWLVVPNLQIYNKWI